VRLAGKGTAMSNARYAREKKGVSLEGSGGEKKYHVTKGAGDSRLREQEKETDMRFGGKSALRVVHSQTGGERTQAFRQRRRDTEGN